MMTNREWRATWIGWGIAVVASLLFTVLAAALESTVNPPGTRTVAPPVLWALGGALGLSLGAFFASVVTRRFWPGALAALVGAAPFLVLVLVGYNDDTLDLHDQVIGSILVVVLPAVGVGLVAAAFGKAAGRLLTRGRLRTSRPGTRASGGAGGR
jgi:hypothetical protein